MIRHNMIGRPVNAEVKKASVCKSVCLPVCFCCCLFVAFVCLRTYLFQSPVNAEVKKGICEQICEGRNVLKRQVSPLSRVLRWHHGHGHVYGHGHHGQSECF